MFFTQEDYRKIEEYLRLRAKKDTDFPIATAVTDSDYISIVLNNLNKIISIKDLRDSILKGVEASIIVTPNTIYAETSTKVTIGVQVNKIASSIVLYRDMSLIGYIENDNSLQIEEDVIALSNAQITYKAVIVVDDISEPLIRLTILSVEKKESTIAWDLETLLFEVDADYSGQFPLLLNVPTGATVTYASSDLNVATISNNGTITIIGTGTTIISASTDETEIYKDKTVTYTLIINKAVCPIGWNALEVETIIGNPVTLPSLLNSKNLNVTLSSSDTSIAEVIQSNPRGTLYSLNILAVGHTTIYANFEGNNIYLPAHPSYRLTVKEVPIPDYYVGYAIGSNSYDDVINANASELIALTDGPHSISLMPTYVKTISASESDPNPGDLREQQVFFIMWKEGSAPKNGSMDTGLITPFSAEDFVSTDSFIILRDNIAITTNGLTINYHLAGCVNKFYEGNTFTINF